MCESAREQTSRTSKNISSSQTKYANLRITQQTIITSAVIIHLLLQYVLYPETFLHQVVRTLPNYILNELDPTVDNYGGRRIDWFNWNIYMPGFVCRCAKKAKELGYDVIGLQHYGQQTSIAGMQRQEVCACLLCSTLGVSCVLRVTCKAKEPVLHIFRPKNKTTILYLQPCLTKQLARNSLGAKSMLSRCQYLE